MENQTKDSFYRGGSNFEARPNEVRIDPKTNTVKPTHGILEAHIRFCLLPNTLKIVQKGRDPRHHEVVPREANLLTYEQYQEELSKIQAILEE